MEKLSKILNRGSELVLAVFLSALALVVFLQVIFRYLLHLPLFWTEETARYCLVWASFLGAGVALRKGQHIAVTILVDRLPPKARVVFVRASQVSMAVIVAVIFWGGIDLVQITQSQISPALRIPMCIPYLAIPIGSAIMMVHLIASLLSPLPPSQADTCRL
ncbi:TRAP transporter small permease [Dethiosulfatarculus sandiegensis]|uniref:C4-dicarboxylate ABC transporter permease n=1 Tax=Dethiosulfatarculus sandiegensis TaxID=1429043 RepID=A0A0D2GGX6_9BACT|nr:TRAP transporter small permease [Dethiosulfatarculus sandiegensis]KIX14182.1 C4-dicarboxylate ABC transporter permease [Dethiosulfatarculus sandiegensis]